MARYEDLTLKQRTLIDELLKGTPKAQAYRIAYPNSKNSNPTRQVDNMINNNCGNYGNFAVVYKEMQQEAYNKAQEQKKASLATKTDLLAFLSDVSQGKIKDVFVTKEGEQFNVDANLTVRIKAAESLIKEYNLVAANSNSDKGDSIIVVDDVPDEGDEDED